ncbi:MAG: alpha/beta hydrolase-fold protein [Deltaproteobacteria bacterium]
MKKGSIIILFAGLIFSSGLTGAELKITITSLPSDHPWEESVYIAGDFNNWNPGNETHKLTKNNDNTYSITLNGTGTIKFKFTRGSWAKVEKGINCTELGNRSFTYGSSGTYNAQIINWADKCGGTHTAQTNVSILTDTFFMPQLNRYRRIWLYLPPDYNTSQVRYPVIYMQDGQNLFDAFYSFAGEWGIDESLNNLAAIAEGKCIVVGIDNGGNNRINEYSPWINPTYGGGEGDKYIKFITETLKPFIDSRYRTLTDRANTGIMGSSMGALISYYAGVKYQETFGKTGIFSPSFWFSQESFKLAEQYPKKFDSKFYFLAGGQESGVAQNCKTIINLLKNSGFQDNELYFKEVPSGQHSEWFWKQEFPAAYQWLFPKPTNTEDLNIKKLDVFPNPASGIIIIENENINSGYAEVFNNLGICKFQFKLNKFQTQINISELDKGLYYILIKAGDLVYSSKFLKK